MDLAEAEERLLSILKEVGREREVSYPPSSPPPSSSLISPSSLSLAICFSFPLRGSMTFGIVGLAGCVGSVGGETYPVSLID
jgi:hypothetical protein